MRTLQKEGENGNPNMSSVRIYGKIMSTIKKKIQETGESRLSITQGDDDP